MGIACVVRKKIHFFAKPLGFHHALELGMCPPFPPAPACTRLPAPGAAHLAVPFMHAWAGGVGRMRGALRKPDVIHVNSAPIPIPSTHQVHHGP